MKIRGAFLLMLIAALASTQSAAAVEPKPQPTRVVILGVDHSAQLVSEADQPGMLTAFMEQLHPNAICIERTPELAERRDFYEFTYEDQGIILPFVASHPTELCPMDWMPSVSDQKLVFGTDLDVPPEIRPKAGYQAFMAFTDPNVVHTGFLEGDDPKVLQPVIDHMLGAGGRADRDFPRRLYLYRTYMMAEHIRAAAHAHPGGTILVVVGYFHKPDLEAHLKWDPAIALVSATSIGKPSVAAAEQATTVEQRAAILSFNLLGRQAATGVHDLDWVARVLDDFARERPGPEADLLRVRLDELAGRLSAKAAAQRYDEISRRAGEQLKFTWTGQKDASRLDSYFDPFGGLGVADRARLESARARLASGGRKEAELLLAQVRSHLDERRALAFDAYVDDYIRPARHLAG
jgi:hypothetical protein